MKLQKKTEWKDENWYGKLDEKRRYIADLIYKYHGYFSSQDIKYRRIVHALKIVIFTLGMLSTICLGLKTIIYIDTQIVIGLILSALITFITAIASYFNFEEYWMRNISIHIQLNILRDNFIFEAESNRLSDERVEYYKDELDKIQKNNILYWENAIKRF